MLDPAAGTDGPLVHVLAAGAGHGRALRERARRRPAATLASFRLRRPAASRAPAPKTSVSSARWAIPPTRPPSGAETNSTSEKTCADGANGNAAEIRAAVSESSRGTIPRKITGSTSASARIAAVRSSRASVPTSTPSAPTAAPAAASAGTSNGSRSHGWLPPAPCTDTATPNAIASRLPRTMLAIAVRITFSTIERARAREAAREPCRSRSRRARARSLRPRGARRRSRARPPARSSAAGFRAGTSGRAARPRGARPDARSRAACPRPPRARASSGRRSARSRSAAPRADRPWKRAEHLLHLRRGVLQPEHGHLAPEELGAAAVHERAQVGDVRVAGTGAAGAGSAGTPRTGPRGARGRAPLRGSSPASASGSRAGS